MTDGFSLHVGDVREVLLALPDKSVDCVVTSPPYWSLRDYGTGEWEDGDPDCDHAGYPAISNKSTLAGYSSEQIKLRTNTASPWRAACGKCGARRVDQQIGLEATPAEYVEALVGVFQEVRRVLADHGSVWLNLGDSFQAKQLLGIPWRVAFALQDDGWWLRGDVIWSKLNPMPESVTDRPSKAHEYVFVLTKKSSYWWDQEAVREPAEWNRWGTQTNGKYEGTASGAGWISTKTKEELNANRRSYPPGQTGGNTPNGHVEGSSEGMPVNPAGRNMRSVWEIATQPYADAHFATFPEELARRAILAGCAKEVCRTCGKPRRRIVERIGGPQGDHTVGAESDGADEAVRATGRSSRASGSVLSDRYREHGYAEMRSVGWTDCGHGDFRRGVLLDPFVGSGTAAVVALRNGRDAVGIELSAEFAELCRKRVGRWWTTPPRPLEPLPDQETLFT